MNKELKPTKTHPATCHQNLKTQCFLQRPFDQGKKSHIHLPWFSCFPMKKFLKKREIRIK